MSKVHEGVLYTGAIGAQKMQFVGISGIEVGSELFPKERFYLIFDGKS